MVKERVTYMLVCLGNELADRVTVKSFNRYIKGELYGGGVCRDCKLKAKCSQILDLIEKWGD